MFIGRQADAAASEIIPPPPVTSSLLSTKNHMRCRTTLPREARDRRNELYSDGILPSAERKHKVYNEIKALHGTKGYLLKTHQNWCSAKELELGLRPRKRRLTPPRPANADDIREFVKGKLDEAFVAWAKDAQVSLKVIQDAVFDMVTS
ncbi:hypothetical protein C8Q76DRAFT_799941 [Earliella scabrosa]|nr:hypothetical protein C8Q76DRAFT_799941 [Earliella scabrosa]